MECHSYNKPGQYLNQCPFKKGNPITLAHFSLSQQQLEILRFSWLEKQIMRAYFVHVELTIIVIEHAVFDFFMNILRLFTP